nr:13050_t:CDS:2 [Entrophospora candida]
MWYGFQWSKVINYDFPQSIQKHPCPTCKGTDHSHSSSNHCKFQEHCASKSVQEKAQNTNDVHTLSHGPW